MDNLSRLAQAAAAGDEQALHTFIETAYEQVRRLCAALVDPQSAGDLAQEALLKAVRALPDYRADASARTWLLAIARHTCLDELRSRYRRHPNTDPFTDDADPTKTANDPSENLIVTDLLDRLQPDQRTAFVLTQIIGLNYHEAAQICDCPTGTIRSRVARARAHLLQALDTAEQLQQRRTHRRQTTTG